MKVKLTPKTAFIAVLLIWVWALAPFFVPALNRLEPAVLGLPFIVFWEFTATALLVLLTVVCRNLVWDTFDREEKREEKGGDK